ncbi:transposase [Clostridium tyrobutyricum]|uniref:transposase n=1 Tax=Clostridium tyrobutyricum TaxID=1519 RepID=UPI002010FC43|nr:transposase [Clostridium tyrobutyricum]MBR9649491.1 transposase [Clostridium tyrobutyricum]
MKGRSYSKELKESIINEVKEVGNISLVSRKHGISNSTISTLIRNSKKASEIKVKPGRKALVEGQNDFEKEINNVTQENDSLKKLLGEKDLEIAILKDLIKKANPQLKIK